MQVQKLFYEEILWEEIIRLSRSGVGEEASWEIFQKEHEGGGGGGEKGLLLNPTKTTPF
jgi:hypothetical protein